MTATTLALRALLDASVAYTAAARAHHEASFYDDEEAMDQANIAAEAAYKDLIKAQTCALNALGAPPEPTWPPPEATPTATRCNLCGGIGNHTVECRNGLQVEPSLNDLMLEHGISVWMDPDWWEGSALPRWLAGQNIRAEEGSYYSTLTGSDPSSIEADNTASGDTPEEAVRAVVAKLRG